MKRASLLLALTLALTLALPAYPQMPATDLHAWKPAPAMGGAVAWSVFAAAKLDVVNRNGSPIFVVKLTDELQKLNGQKVRINGFMMPLEPSNEQKHFLMLAYPLSCPFHLSIGGSQIIEVKVQEAVRFSYEPVLLEGVFRLTDPAASGLVFMLDDAHVARYDQSSH